MVDHSYKHLSIRQGHCGAEISKFSSFKIYKVNENLLYSSYSGLCGDQNWKEIQKRGDICIRKADSLCHTAETNTNVKQLYANKINLKKQQQNTECLTQATVFSTSFRRLSRRTFCFFHSRSILSARP